MRDEASPNANSNLPGVDDNIGANNDDNNDDDTSKLDDSRMKYDKNDEANNDVNGRNNWRVKYGGNDLRIYNYNNNMGDIHIHYHYYNYMSPGGEEIHGVRPTSMRFPVIVRRHA